MTIFGFHTNSCRIPFSKRFSQTLTKQMYIGLPWHYRPGGVIWILADTVFVNSTNVSTNIATAMLSRVTSLPPHTKSDYFHPRTRSIFRILRCSGVWICWKLHLYDIICKIFGKRKKLTISRRGGGMCQTWQGSDKFVTPLNTRRRQNIQLCAVQQFKTNNHTYSIQT